MSLPKSIHQSSAGVILSVILSIVAHSSGQTLQTLFTFRGSNGILPWAGVVEGPDGNFYGTTHDGFNATAYGTVFRITRNGSFSTVIAFNGSNGKWPYSGLALGGDGNFYGTTSQGGTSDAGTVFRLTTNGTLTTLASFNGISSAYPHAGLVQASDGNFYGSSHYSFGSVFRVTTNGAVSTAVTLNGTNGSGDVALTLGSDGLLYGTTTFGGSNNGSGTIFKMTVGGALTTMVVFRGGNGAVPVGIVQGHDGNFYGTTMQGGAFSGTEGSGINGHGTVFQVTSNGVLTTLVSFDGTNGRAPNAGLVQASDGNFCGTTTYGGTHDLGTAFQITPSGNLTTLISFSNPSGVDPMAGFVQASDGQFYGTAPYDSDPNGYGTIFRIVMPVSLNSMRAANELVLSWSTNFSVGFVFQSAFDLTIPANWTDSTNPPAVVNGEYVVTNAFSGDANFRDYQLHKPTLMPICSVYAVGNCNY